MLFIIYKFLKFSQNYWKLRDFKVPHYLSIHWSQFLFLRMTCSMQILNQHRYLSDHVFLFLFQTMYSDGLLTLHYGKHPATLAAEVGAWYSGDRHVDVTLACDDGSVVKAHRVVLAAASPLLASLLRNPALDHVVHLSGVRKTQLNHLLEFLYNGEALIPVWILSHNIILACKQNFERKSLLA